jgi:glutathione S-transferase
LQFFPSWEPFFKSKTAEDRDRAQTFKNAVPAVETLEKALPECSISEGSRGLLL